MLNQLAQSCNIIELNRKNLEGSEIDFNALIPKADNLSDYELDEIELIESAQRAGQGCDRMPLDILNGLLTYFLEKRDFRSVLWVTLQANTGLRYVDISNFRKIDLINENNQFRESVLETERKTGKKRINFINDSIKMATLMYLWDNPQIQALDLLFTAGKNANNKGYERETYIDDTGRERLLRVNGKYVYKLDENGNKIAKPLSRWQASSIMHDALINGLGIAIKNDKRTKSSSNAYLKLATHSLRKAYSEAVIDYYVKLFDKDIAYATAAAMEQLEYDLNHSSRAMTYHYVGNYVETKRKINMAMNLGIEVLRPYFEAEKEKQYAK